MTIAKHEKIIQILDENNIDYKERINSITLKCPVCFKYKLDIHKEQGYFICYHCASQNNVKGKNAAYILAKILDKPYHELNFKLNFFDVNDIDNNFDQPKTKVVAKKIENTQVIQWPQHFFRINLDISKPGVEYLNKRGIDLATAKKHEIRYNAKDYQVVFPVFSNNDLVGYQGRSILPEVPKQFTKFTMPGFQKANFLMFEKTINQDHAIMAEGPISALKFEKTNVPFVATMGKYVSVNQLKVLSEKKVKKNIFSS